MWLLFLVACYVSVNGGKTHSNTELELCCAQWLSRVRLFATPWTVAQQSLLSMGFSRRECWSGLLFPSPTFFFFFKFIYLTALLWKILREMGIPDHLTCLLRNLYAGQEATVRTEHGITDWFQIGESISRLYIVTLLI